MTLRLLVAALTLTTGCITVTTRPYGYVPPQKIKGMEEDCTDGSAFACRNLLALPQYRDAAGPEGSALRAPVVRRLCQMNEIFCVQYADGLHDIDKLVEVRSAIDALCEKPEQLCDRSVTTRCSPPEHLCRTARAAVLTDMAAVADAGARSMQ
jgi:hypothetical protein